MEINHPVSNRGGARKGAGRKPGVATAKTRIIAERAMAEGITPLEFMLKVMRQELPENAPVKLQIAHQAMQFEAAKAAAPYIHPRLQSVEVKNPDGEAFKTEDVSRPKLTRAEWLAAHGLRPIEDA